MKRNKIEKSIYHRLFILFIILILPVFFIKEYRLIRAKKDTKVLSAEAFCLEHLQPYEDKSFTFIVLTQNNVDSVEQNFHSIIKQEYLNYQIVYIDQGSTDGTQNNLKRLISKQSRSITLIECEKNHELYQKYYEVVQSSPDSEVIIHLYGSDWLAHDDVLSSLNTSYSNPNVWLTYGQYLDYSSYKKGIYNPRPKQILHKKRSQRAPWVVAPFKTYYASLFKKMKIEPPTFLSIKNDNALLRPIVELGRAHVRFIPDVLTIHRDIAPNKKRGHRVALMAGKVAQLALTQKNQKITDLMILSRGTPERLKSCLESSLIHLHGIHRINVLYDCDEESFSGYERLKEQFSDVNFIRPVICADAGFKSAFLSVLLENSSPYLILTTDEVSLKESVPLSACVEAMRKTRAYGFYLHLGRGVDEALEAGVTSQGIFMWNIRQNEGPFGEPDVLKMGLYRRLDLEKDLRELSFSSAESLITAWNRSTHSYRIGLSFATSTTFALTKRES
ncbi:MAG: hypothetical protein K1060chlam2_00379 [Chlamydiae bacterium]|nr:hypothetical protein [Chlamydiota bacterium]